MRRFRNFAIADHQIRASADDRRNETRDVCALVLIVGIGVDDDIGAEPKCGVDARDERRRKSSMCPELHDVCRARLPRNVDGVVGAAVVDDQGFDR